MHLVDKKKRALAGLAPRPRRIEHFLQVGDAGKHRGDLLEMQFSSVRQKPRHGGLAGTRWSPENQRAECARLEHARQRAVRSQNVILANDLGKRARTHPVGERMRRILRQPRGGEEISALLCWLPAHPPSVTLICWPPRTIWIRQSRELSRVAFSRSLVLAIFWLFTARMMSPFWKPTLAAVRPAARSVTTTPSVSASRCISSAAAGEILATFAPWNGERVVSTISLRPTSGAVSSGIVSLTGLPARCTSISAAPPSGRVAKR